MRKINWGVMGTAGIAKGQTIPGMQQAENCNLYAIAGRSLEKAQAFQKEFGFEKAYGSYAELLADPQVEAVYIPLPNELHDHIKTGDALRDPCPTSCTTNGPSRPWRRASTCCAKSLWRPHRSRWRCCTMRQTAAV